MVISISTSIDVKVFYKDSSPKDFTLPSDTFDYAGDINLLFIDVAKSCECLQKENSGDSFEATFNIVQGISGFQISSTHIIKN